MQRIIKNDQLVDETRHLLPASRPWTTCATATI